jgi:molybdenum cofactor cytidylyltransferase
VKIAALLLAAGRSTRFGADKLSAPLRGVPLGQHAARTLLQLPFTAHIVVTRPGRPDWPGFDLVENDRPEEGMARSIGLGMDRVRQAGAEAVMIALADMPYIPVDHVGRLLAACRGSDARIASGDGRQRSPPALFGSRWFDALQDLTGDRGARDLLDRAEIVLTDPQHLIDIDRPEDIPGS